MPSQVRRIGEPLRLLQKPNENLDQTKDDQRRYAKDVLGLHADLAIEEHRTTLQMELTNEGDAVSR